MKGPRSSDPVRPGKNGKKKKESGSAASSMLRLYLHEMGGTPLLDAQQETRLARQLHDARLEIANLAQALPESCRELVLADESGPALGAAWPLGQLEEFLGKLVPYAAQFPDTRVAVALQRIRSHKATLDHARNGLILANLRLVVHIAKKYANRGLAFMDLIQEGNVGLLRAVEKFEHGRGNKFTTYAYWWITQAVERGIADKSRTIRIPAHATATIRRVEFAARDMGQRLGRDTTPQEIAQLLNMPLETVNEALSVVREPLPLEGTVEGEGYNVVRPVADTRAPSPFNHASQREIEQRVQSALGRLHPREESIIRMRFGIGSDTARTLAQIGQLLRLSRERVRQIEWVALAKIRASPQCRELAGM